MIDPNDWRFKLEQGPGETREEWKARTFSMRYGTGPKKLSDLLGRPVLKDSDRFPYKEDDPDGDS